MKETVLEVENVCHWFGNKHVLCDINISIDRGQFVALVGPSGCGKSTLLKAILGTHPPKSGKVMVDGKQILKPSRNIGIVYQHYSLFDFLTVEKNVAFGPMLDETSIMQRMFWYPFSNLKKYHLKEANEILEKVGLAEAKDLYPKELSGGMRQRVAIAQALIMQPKLLLLDEPFGALDEAMREELHTMLLNIKQHSKSCTIVIVTHELKEAIIVADRIIGLSQNHNEREKGAIIVYDKPAPIVKPEDDRDLLNFGNQQHEIRQALAGVK